MPRRVAILIDSLKSGGAQKQSALLARLLSTKYEVVFIVLDGRDARPSFIEILDGGSGIRKYTFNGGKIMSFIQVYRVLKEEKPDFLFSYLPFGNLINGVVGKLAGIPFRLGGIRNSHLENSKFVVQRYVHNFLLTASISNSFAGKINHEMRGQNKKPIFHIPNCFPISFGLIKRDWKSTVQILSVGRFVQQKNYDLALEAIAKCKRHLIEIGSQVKINYIIIGYGTLENHIRSVIEKLDLNDEVTVITDPPNINDYYIAADIYLSTSLFEGISNSIMEAMSFSLPIVATDVGGNHELVKNGYNGYLTRADAIEIAEYLFNLVTSIKLRTELGEQSFWELENGFSEAIFLAKYSQLMEDFFEANKLN